jgi:hypothetical protein
VKRKNFFWHCDLMPPGPGRNLNLKGIDRMIVRLALAALVVICLIGLIASPAPAANYGDLFVDVTAVALPASPCAFAPATCPPAATAPKACTHANTANTVTKTRLAVRILTRQVHVFHSVKAERCVIQPVRKAVRLICPLHRPRLLL